MILLTADDAGLRESTVLKAPVQPLRPTSVRRALLMTTLLIVWLVTFATFFAWKVPPDPSRPNDHSLAALSVTIGLLVLGALAVRQRSSFGRRTLVAVLWFVAATSMVVNIVILAVFLFGHPPPLNLRVVLEVGVIIAVTCFPVTAFPMLAIYFLRRPDALDWFDHRNDTPPPAVLPSAPATVPGPERR